MRRHRRFSASVPLVSAACLLVGIVGIAPPVAAQPVPRPQPSRSAVAVPPVSRAAEAKAAAAAKTSGKRVEVLSRRSPTAQTFANPNGTFTLEQYAHPVRVQRPDGSWTPVDTTLRRGRDGLIRPGAVMAPLAFSGGGTAPLVQQGAAGGRMSMSWPRTLPAPTISGATLTYAKVFPGVDLRVTAYAEGFTATLVVASRQSAADPALRRIPLPLRGDGETMKADGAGGLAAVDRSGKVRFRVAAPQVSDSTRRADSTRTPRGGGRLSVARDQATVSPDMDALAAPGVAFPAYVDIAGGGPVWHWTMMDASHPNQSYWSYDRSDCPTAWGGHECAKMGQAYGSDPDTYRSLFDFDTSTLGHKNILGAQFSINVIWSPDNTDRPVELWSTGPIGPGTTWNNTSFFLWQDTRSSHSHDQVARRMEFNALAAMRDVSGRAGPTLTLGLKAPNESDEFQWKKFDATTAHLSVTYNSYPATPDQMSTDYNWCANGWIKSTTPTLRVHAHDDDGAQQPLRMAFAWGKPDGNGGWTVIGSGDQWNVPSDTIAQFTVPAGQLPDGGTYAWWAQANDGRDNSPQTGRCVFQIDATPPEPPKAVGSPDYPDDGGDHGQVGQPGTFTITPPDSRQDDVVAYVYGPNSAPSADATIPAAADKTATVRYTPDRDGPNHLYVWAKDKAGNLSDVTHPLVYDFGVNPGAGPVARWSLEEGSGTVAADGSGHGHGLTLSGAVAWAPGRNGNGLRFDGTTGAATTAAVVPTDHNHSVSAWVRITDTAQTRTLVAQNGTVNSAMRLQYRADDNRWTFGAASSDTTGATRVRAVSVAPPQVGVWTHLVGEYDAANQQLRLYVNGVLEGTASYTTAWNATGPLTVGSSLWDGSRTDYWAGDVDDVRVWDRTLAPDEVLNAYSNLPTLAKIPASRATGSAPCAPDETPDKAVDGVVAANAKFCSQAALPWLQLDLSAARTISEVVVRHAEAGGETAGMNTRDFDVRTSQNGTDWTTVLKVRGNTRAVSRLSLPTPVTAAYIKINVLTPTQTSDTAARIDEVEVYGMTASLINAAAGRPVTASPAVPCASDEDRGNATDGSVATKWCGMRGSGDLRLEVDLGEVTPIWWVSVANAEAGGEAAGYNSRDYDIQISTDGTTWIPVDQTRGNVAAISGHALVPSIRARYVRIALINPTQDAEQTARIYELQVYARG